MGDNTEEKNPYDSFDIKIIFLAVTLNKLRLRFSTRASS